MARMNRKHGAKIRSVQTLIVVSRETMLWADVGQGLGLRAVLLLSRLI